MGHRSGTRPVGQGWLLGCPRGQTHDAAHVSGRVDNQDPSPSVHGWHQLAPTGSNPEASGLQSFPAQRSPTCGVTTKANVLELSDGRTDSTQWPRQAALSSSQVSLVYPTRASPAEATGLPGRDLCKRLPSGPWVGVGKDPLLAPDPRSWTIVRPTTGGFSKDPGLCPWFSRCFAQN